MDNPKEFCLQTRDHTYKFNKTPVVVGRNATAHISLTELFISRNHCELKWEGQKWWLEDKSSSGTYINKRLVGKGNSRVLVHGDHVCLSAPNQNDKLEMIFQICDEIKEKVNKTSLEDSLHDLDVQSQVMASKKRKMEDRLKSMDNNFLNKLRRIDERHASQKLHVLTEEASQQFDNEAALEKEKLKKEWEGQKKQLLAEIESAKSVEDSLKCELERLRKTIATQENELKDAEQRAMKEKEKLLKEKQRELERSAAQLQEYHRYQLQMLQEDKVRAVSDLQAELEKKEIAEKELEKKLEAAQSETFQNFENLIESELQCIICSELFISAVTLNCSHTFCSFCLKEWKKTQCSCPVCRTKISSENRALSVDNFIEKMVETLSEDYKVRRGRALAERREAERTAISLPRRGRRSRLSARMLVQTVAQPQAYLAVLGVMNRRNPARNRGREEPVVITLDNSM